MANTVDEIATFLRENYKGAIWEIGESSFRIEVYTNRGRSQIVYLTIESLLQSGVDISRYVCQSTIGLLSPSLRTSGKLQMILRRNLDLDIGTIAIQDRPLRSKPNLRGPHLVYRATHLAMTADWPEIEELVTKTAIEADKLEARFYGGEDEN